MLLKISDEKTAALESGEPLIIFICKNCRNMNIRLVWDTKWDFCENCGEVAVWI